LVTSALRPTSPRVGRRGSANKRKELQPSHLVTASDLYLNLIKLNTGGPHLGITGGPDFVDKTTGHRRAFGRRLGDGPGDALHAPGGQSRFVLRSSDSTGMFGNECPLCKGYWRSKHVCAVCPYCAFQSEKHFHFLTQAQRRYVAEYCATLGKALESGQPGEYIIDMDAVADAAGRDAPKPTFYYAEEKQQNLFTCHACDSVTDVLGTYAYCSLCRDP
jgi:hypothetical protein